MGTERKVVTGLALKVAIGLGILGTAAVGGTIAVGLFLAKRSKRPEPLTVEQWAATRTARQDLVRLVHIVANGGCTPSIRPDVWPLLLHMYGPNATTEDQHAVRKECSNLYWGLLRRCQELAASLDNSVVRTGTGVSLSEHASTAEPISAQLAAFAEAQRIIVLDALRTDLLIPNGDKGQHAGASGRTGREAPSNGGQKVQLPWTSRLAEEALSEASHLTQAGKRQAARLINILSAYAVFDPETGYCQGMSDLAAPFLLVFEDDTLAFTCFRCLMQTARRNFRQDQAGIKSQLQSLSHVLERSDAVLFHHLRHVGASDCVFSYRMLLVLLRRELPIQQVLVLWEILWADAWDEKATKQEHKPVNGYLHTNHMSANALQQEEAQPTLLIFFIAAAIIRQRRAVLNSASSDDVMRHFLQAKVDMWPTIIRARGLRADMLNGSKKRI